MRRPYTIKEKLFIEQNLNKMTCTEIAQELDRSKSSIKNYFSRNKLKRDPEIATQMTLKPLQLGRGWNKGISHINENITSFRKGHKPHNEKSDGYISLRSDKSGRKYKYIRIAKGKWILYHRYLWKKHFGEIPKNKIVVFKDRNSMNCTIENLELITKAENLRRNHDRKKQSQSMKQTWRDTKIAHIYGLTPKGKWSNWKRKTKKKQETQKTASLNNYRIPV